MKKTFYSVLRTICVGAMTLFAVSCYDDSALREDIKELEGDLAGVVARLDALEASLNSDVGTVDGLETTLKNLEDSLKELIAANGADVKTALEAQIADLKTQLEKAIADGDKANADAIAEQKVALEEALAAIAEGAASVEDLAAIVAALEAAGSKLQGQVDELYAKVAVVAVEEVDGKIVLTLADGSQVEVSKPVDHDGLVTIVEVDSVKYWQVVGAETHTGVVVGHPDQNIEFQINVETKELEYRVNGTEWISTGVVVEEEVVSACLITGFVEEEDCVKITIGETEIVLPKYKSSENASLVLGRNQAFFPYGSTKKVELQAEGVKDYYVMTKPDGWKATITGTTLNVTAPTLELLDLGAADYEGQVLIHATTEAGLCKVVNFDVETGEAFNFTYADGNVTLFTAYAAEQSNHWGEIMFDFVPMWVGIAPIESYLAYGSAAEFVQAKSDEYDLVGNYVALANQYGMIDQYWYEEGVCEDLTITLPVEKIAEQYNAYGYYPFEYNPDSVYVVFIVPQPAQFEVENAICVFTGNHVSFEAVSSVYNDVTFEASLVGADGYAIGAMSKSMFDSWVDETYTHEDALKEYLVGSWAPGPFGQFTGGNETAMGPIYPAANHTISLSEIVISDPMAGISGDVEANTEYFVWILPYYVNKPLADYTFDDIILTTCKTAPMVHDAAAKANVEIVTVDGVTSYTITPAAGGAFRYEWMDYETYVEYYLSDGAVNEEAVVEAIGWQYPSDEEITEVPWDPEAGMEYVLVVYSTLNGYYSIDAYKYTVPAEEAPAFDTPEGKQWVFNSDVLAEMLAPTDFVLDLAVTAPKYYAGMLEDTHLLVLAMNYEPIYGPDAAGMWVTPGIWGSFTLTPTDAESGVISFNGAEIPYSQYTGTTCTFDLSQIMMTEAIVDATLAETEIFAQIQ